jgi:uncharacterized membrane protein YhaH (DUF805 family)
MMANRIGRLEFVFWCGAPIVAGSIVLDIVAAAVGAPNVPTVGAPLHGLFAIVVLAASIVILKAEISRLHDLGWPGWTVLLAFIPLVSIVVFLLLFLAPGQKTNNPYGVPPLFLQRFRKLA